MDWVKEVLWCLVVHLGIWGIIEVVVLIWWWIRSNRRLDKLMLGAAGVYGIVISPIVSGFLVDEVSRSADVVAGILVSSISILMGVSA